ncbi:M15 family metallopeptidase [Actinomadura sp. WMMA1423]|uniref:M15 family metallopeptidase n=1 Tax=Actinomadura sp. WMMA1423 TaxID=2591108 RepID=UPI0011464445|nr:M15 family metallopeptidase [Actinomadura sp. WMMA1423]
MNGIPPPARSTARRIRRLFALGLVVAVAAIAAALGHRSQTASTSSPGPVLDSPAWSSSPPRPPKAPREKHRGAVGGADGVVPDGVTVFDDEAPAVNKLNPDLLKALRQAARNAAGDGLEFYVNSGWRSPAYQERLLRDAVSKYGSEAAAARWVATPATSPHVSGDAIDIGHTDAAAWLSRNGARFGLCQIYRNEPWHYELRTGAIDGGCPRMYADPTQDPRMRR